ncbi:alpha-mannosidase [Thermasporomyces composti]|uniref:alpha-mannosidase n=1 Tax=Thermasporomyces composti TaxID=696763 RepID=A0A3D9V0P8_THECX|nr:glycoside hydrolase family 38 C-terminal domain-containing protein [Thermasporomyces composti]REF35059.1 alpha-mannosidase [Thermasporomyces composti]
MHDDQRLVEARLERAVRQRLRPALYGETVPLDIEVWHAPGEPVPVSEALAADYKPAAVGDPWGPPWGTSWFRLTGRVPQEWDGKRVEAVVDLGFGGGPGFSAEGLVYTPSGEPIKGLNPDNTYIPIAGLCSGAASDAETATAKGGAEFQVYVEAAANPTVISWPDFAPTHLGDKETAGTDPLYHIRRAELAVLNVDVWNLLLDIQVLDELRRELPADLPRRAEILRALERALDALDYDDIPGTAAAAREQLAGVLAKPAYASAHRITAVGHAHIDSAWLWPLRETVRKVARTVCNVTTLAADHPEFKFAFSQAQQHAWMKEHHPKVWARLKEAVARGQIIPIGGMWVESDTNMPGGEAMARQFVYGKRFFLDEYGVETTVVWLPDSFGYSAALPQLVKLSGHRWFLTQKISWNQVNKFPHHTFWWEGIDGTRIFTHFPPADTYNGQLTGKELAYAQRNYQDKGGGTRSLLPFGHGDGGGGPTREMLARAKRLRDLESSPTVTIDHPERFFEQAHEEYPNAPVWVGELYLELHRGTYTSQAKTKQGNRRSEHLLREAELWSATAAVAGLLDYPYDDLDRIWKAVLLNQFHDILPGSSIRWVHREAEETYARLAKELEAIIERAQRALAGEGTQPIVFNAAPHARAGVPAMGAAVQGGSHAPAVTLTRDGGSLVLDNGLVRVTIDERGLLTSVYEIESGREAIAPGAAGNLLQLHVDTPNMWDAWDVDAFYRNKVTDLVDVDSIEVVRETPEEVAVAVTRSFGSSRITQTVRVRAGECQVNVDNEIDWHEKEKFLKAAFPLDIRADHSASETQFGHVFRPTHTNTSWEAAKFEICAHRWIHVGEPGYGHALVNDSTYGHDVTRDVRPDGGTTTTVRLSLLRAPRVPDPVTDQGVHRLSYALVPGAGIPEAIEEGYRINLPERTVIGAHGVAPLVQVDNPAVVVEAVKLADDRSGDVVVRLYEAHGGRATARLTTSFELASAQETDLLERPTADREVVDGGVELALRPFQIVTLRLRRAA